MWDYWLPLPVVALFGCAVASSCVSFWGKSLGLRGSEGSWLSASKREAVPAGWLCQTLNFSLLGWGDPPDSHRVQAGSSIFQGGFVPKEKLCVLLKAGVQTWIYSIFPLARKESVLVQSHAFEVGFGM